MEEIKLPPVTNQPKITSQIQSSLATPVKTLLRAVPPRENLTKFLPYLVIILVAGLGVFTGLIFSSRAKNKALAPQAAFEEEELTETQKQEFQVVTRDQAEGILEKNDKFEETAQGQWKLIRPGGESQTAYLTSSFLDLDQYVGKKVRVFGETLGSDKVGWLMDVAKAEAIE